MNPSRKALRYLAATALLTAAILCACSSSDSQPTASSSPALTAQEISDRVSTQNVSARIVSVRKANVSGETLDDQMEGVTVGGDLFLKRGAVQLLYFQGGEYTRTSDSSPWKKVEPLLMPAFADFQFMGFSSGPVASPVASPEPGLTRLPDETIDGHQVFHLSGTNELTDTAAVSSLLTTVPFSRVRSIDPSTIARVHGVADEWIDTESFQQRRLKTDFQAPTANPSLTLAKQLSCPISGDNWSFPAPCRRRSIYAQLSRRTGGLDHFRLMAAPRTTAATVL